MDNLLITLKAFLKELNDDTIEIKVSEKSIHRFHEAISKNLSVSGIIIVAEPSRGEKTIPFEKFKSEDNIVAITHNRK